jgi:general secretion pathway protein D
LRLRGEQILPSLLSLAVVFIAGLWVSSCNLTATGPGSNGQEAPDAMDRIRTLNLEPRSPQPQPTTNSGLGGTRALTYYGTDDSQAGAISPFGATSSGKGMASAEEGVELNFENTPVSTIAKVILGDVLKVGYVVDSRVQGNLSLSSGRPVPKSKLLFVLETALRAGNLALVRDGAGYMVTPASEAVGSGNVDAGSAEPGYGVTIMPLRYVSAQNVSKLLEGFSVRAGSIRFDPSGNILVVTGSAPERRSVLDTVANFDMDWMRGQSVGIFPVQNTAPEPVIVELEKIFDTAEGGRGQGLTKFQPIARMNAILAVTKKPEALQMVAAWIRRLDGSVTAAVGVKVYQVRYGDARNLAQLLNQIFGGTSNGGGGLDSAASQVAPSSGVATISPVDRLTGGGQTTLQPQQPMQGQTGTPSSPYGALRPQTGAPTVGGDSATTGSRTSQSAFAPSALPGVRITADPVNNSVLIYASQENYRIIERALQQLDRPQKQVAVDLTIAEVTLNDTLNYGVQFFLKSSDIGLKPDSGSIINTAASAVIAQAFPGFNFLAGSAMQPRLIINALHQYTDVKVLSNPSLVVVDNQPATLQVGDQVPVTTGTATVLSTNNTVVSTVDYKNTGIILRVVPRINSNNTVVLDVEQEISNVADNGQANTLTPTLSQRRVKSTIMVTSGQTVLLAGLINDNQNRNRGGIPVLDQIPVIGDAFGQNHKSAVRTELIIFIRPQVIHDAVDASLIAEELRSKLRGSKVPTVAPPGSVPPLTPRMTY